MKISFTSRLFWPAFTFAIMLGVGPAVLAEPKYTPVPHPSPEEMEKGLTQWAGRFPDALRVSTCGKSGKGRSIILCRITDYSTVSGLVEKVKDDWRYDAKALADVADRIPAENFLPQYRGSGESEPIKNGLVLRLLVPYHDADVSEIRLDGHLVQPSDTDGYHIRHNPGTIVEIAIPPNKVRELHVVSCFYDSPTKRRAGFLPEDWK